MILPHPGINWRPAEASVTVLQQWSSACPSSGLCVKKLFRLYFLRPLLALFVLTFFPLHTRLLAVSTVRWPSTMVEQSTLMGTRAMRAPLVVRTSTSNPLSGLHPSPPSRHPASPLEQWMRLSTVYSRAPPLHQVSSRSVFVCGSYARSMTLSISLLSLRLLHPMLHQVAPSYAASGRYIEAKAK